MHQKMLQKQFLSSPRRQLRSHIRQRKRPAYLESSKPLTVFRFAICPHTRNVTDSTLKRLRNNGGLLMISFVPAFTHTDATKASVEHVVDHIQHVGLQIGYDHVGIGTDYDGMEKPVIGLEDVSKFPDLVFAMLRRGITRTQIEQIIGLNIIRVLSAVETAAKSIRTSGQCPALVEEVKQLWNDDIRAYVRRIYPNTVHDT
jgi:membrane dipeptidase